MNTARAHTKFDWLRRAAGWRLRPGQALVAGVSMLLLATLTSLLLAGVAGAAPSPPPAPAPSPSLPAAPNPLDPTLPPPLTPPVGPAAPQEPGTAEKAIEEAKKKAATEKKKLSGFEERVEAYKKDRRNGGVLSAFEVTDRDGNPVSSYRIFSDTGDWKAWDLKIQAFLVESLFLATKWMVSFACFLIAWSLSFKLAGLLLKPALTVSTSLYTNVFVQLGLPALFLTYAGVVAGWHLMFGRRTRGWGEAAAALVISALAVTALAAPPQMLLSEQDGAVGTARSLAIEVAALVLDNEKAITAPKTTLNKDVNDRVPAGATAGAQVRGNSAALARPITDALVDAFVVRPAMLLSYGQVWDDKSKGQSSCAARFRDSRIKQAVFDDIIDNALDAPTSELQDLPWVGSLIPDGSTVVPQSWQDKVMEVGPAADFEKDCVKGEAGTLKKASMDKVGGAAFMTLAAFLVCLFIVVVDGTFLMAQIWIAFEAMLAKVALTVGVLPGPGRAWLWTRATSVLKSLTAMVLAVLALAVLIVVITAILNSPEKDLPGGLTVRFVVIDLLCIAAFVFRKRLNRATQSFAQRARVRLGNSPLGGQAPADLGGQQPRRGLGRKLMVGGMMLGALAATGGTASASLGSARGAGALTRRLAQGSGRILGGTARAAAGTTKLAAKGTLAVGKLGLKSTVGLPVYGPRAVRRTGAALTAVPGQVTGGAASLGQRLQHIHQQYTQPVQDIAGQSARGWRNVGRRMRGRQPLPYVPPRRATSTRPGPARPAPARPVTGPTRTTAARPARTAPAPTVTPPPARPRPVPPRVAQPAASPAQAALQVRLHRMRSRQPRATPATAPVPRPMGPAPRRRSGGRP